MASVHRGNGLTKQLVEQIEARDAKIRELIG